MTKVQNAWAKAIVQPGREFGPTELPVLSGEIPIGLQGTLYQNGPGCLERGGKRVGHWFDGDGAILAVHFNSNQQKNKSRQNTAPQNRLRQDGPRQNGPRQNGPRQNGPRQNGPWQNGPRQNDSRQDGSRQDGPRQNGPRQDGSRQDGKSTVPTATGLYRYVKSTEYQAEVNADRFLFSNYGMTAPGPLWQRWGKPVKNAANTSVLALPDRLLTLWEGGLPHALDLQTLETLGLDHLGGLGPKATYSAHPKQDAQTGYIYNFGLGLGLNATLNLYVSDRRGNLLQTRGYRLNGIPLIHDFVMAGSYLVFCIPPLRLRLLPCALGLQSYSDAFEWQPQRGTQILIFDRETLHLVSRAEVAPWYQWHFGNGYVTQFGQIVMDLVRYPDFQTNQRLKEIATGELRTQAIGELWRLVIDPQTAQVQESQCLLPQSCDFPCVAPADCGQYTSKTYLALHPLTMDVIGEVFGAIACYDHRDNQRTIADLGMNYYPFAPIYAKDCFAPDQGWILTIVFDGNHDSSEVWIFASDQLDAGPVCRLGLPEIIPFGFHGTWAGAA